MTNSVDSKRIVPNELSMKIWSEEKDYLSTGITRLTYELPICFHKGKNDILWDVDGQSYIDWSGGTLTISTGHCNENVSEAIKKQIDLLWNVHDHPIPQRIEVLKKLRKLLGNDNYVYQFYSGGSEAIEAAIRAAYSYQSFRKRKIASFREGFHGKTRGSIMAVHALYGKSVNPNYLAPVSIPFPKCYRCPYDKEKESCNLFCASETVRILESDPSIGMFIFEPILGTGGVYGPPPGFWDIVKKACRELKILLIADEITAGAYRTGTFLAVEQLNISPDLVVFGKGIGSGFPAMILAGRKDTMCYPGVFCEDNSSSTIKKAEFLGQDFRALGGASTTFGGNPLAIAAINATLKEFDRLDIKSHIREVSNILSSELLKMVESYDVLGEVRTWGLLIGVELVTDKKTKMPNQELAINLYHRCAENGLLIKMDDRGIIHITPPLTLTKENAIKSVQIFEDTLKELL